MTRTIFIAAGLALVAILPAAPAQAQTRAFVSAAGSDNNNCINTNTPCRHFQNAYNAMPAGGEIDVLDPGNYGALTVNHGLSIVGRGWATVGAVSGAASITINAGSSDTITISGVQLDGAGTSNTNGIEFNSGGGLTVTDCLVQNFNGFGAAGTGILMQPSSGAVKFIIANSVIVNNGYNGFWYHPTSGSATANGVIDHVVATNNSYGIAINIADGGGATTVAIANGTVSNNSTVGILFLNSSASLAASIDNTAVTSNASGIEACGTVNVLLTRSVIQGNGSGITNNTSPNTFYTYGNNLIDLNGLNGSSNISSPLNATVTLR
jgi:Right handed beta helix region